MLGVLRTQHVRGYPVGKIQHLLRVAFCQEFGRSRVGALVPTLRVGMQSGCSASIPRRRVVTRIWMGPVGGSQGLRSSFSGKLSRTINTGPGKDQIFPKPRQLDLLREGLVHLAPGAFRHTGDKGGDPRSASTRKTPPGWFAPNRWAYSMASWVLPMPPMPITTPPPSTTAAPFSSKISSTSQRSFTTFKAAFSSLNFGGGCCIVQKDASMVLLRRVGDRRRFSLKSIKKNGKR